MQATHRWGILVILALIGNVPAYVALGLYRSDRWGPWFKLLADKSDVYAPVATGSAFSMVGFLAAVMALFSLIGQSSAMTKYRQNGHLWVLLCAMALTMLETAIAFVLGLRLFFGKPPVEMVGWSFIVLVGSMGMLLICMVPSLGLQLRASREP